MSGLEFLTMVPDLLRVAASIHETVKIVKDAPKHVAMLQEEVANYSGLLEMFATTINDAPHQLQRNMKAWEVGISIKKQCESIMKQWKSLWPTVECLVETSGSSIWMRSYAYIRWRIDRGDFIHLVHYVNYSKASMTLFILIVMFRLMVEKKKRSGAVTASDRRELSRLQRQISVAKRAKRTSERRLHQHQAHIDGRKTPRRTKSRRPEEEWANHTLHRAYQDMQNIALMSGGVASANHPAGPISSAELSPPPNSQLVEVRRRSSSPSEVSISQIPDLHIRRSSRHTDRSSPQQHPSPSPLPQEAGRRRPTNGVSVPPYDRRNHEDDPTATELPSSVHIEPSNPQLPGIHGPIVRVGRDENTATVKDGHWRPEVVQGHSPAAPRSVDGDIDE